MAEKITIARPYAQAVFDLAREQGDFKRWSEMLNLVAEVVAHPDMARLIDDPRVTREQLIGLLLVICDKGLDEAGRNLVRLLAENHRLEMAPEITALYEIERATAEGTVRAEIISASTLTDDQRSDIAAALKRRLGREVTLEARVDDTLLGGAIIRAGDLVIDGSVAGKLERLGGELLH